MSRPRLCLGRILGFFLQSKITTTRRKTPACLGCILAPLRGSGGCRKLPGPAKPVPADDGRVTLVFPFAQDTAAQAA